MRAKPWRLTQREIEVLTALATGDTWKSAAVRLAISPETVRFHIANLKRKLGAANALAAITRVLFK